MHAFGGVYGRLRSHWGLGMGAGGRARVVTLVFVSSDSLRMLKVFGCRVLFAWLKGFVRFITARLLPSE